MKNLCILLLLLVQRNIQAQESGDLLFKKNLNKFKTNNTSISVYKIKKQKYKETIKTYKKKYQIIIGKQKVLFKLQNKIVLKLQRRIFII